MFQELKSKCCSKTLAKVNREQFGAKDYFVCCNCHSEFKIDDITPMKVSSKKAGKRATKKRHK